MRRRVEQKILDIKAVRSIMRILGMLHIPSCYRVMQEMAYEYDDKGNATTIIKHRESYGIGLKEAKDYVEAKYIYYHTYPTPTENIEVGNVIQAIKATRQFMNTLNKLGLKSPDAGLRICKDFHDRVTGSTWPRS